MASKHSVGTIFIELDLDPSRYTKGQQRLYKDATQVALGIEDNFKKLGIKSSAEMDLMRQKITNSYNMIANNSKATANDIVRAEQAKNDQLKRLNDQQFGHQTSLIESVKKNWLGYTAAIAASYYAINKAVDFIGTLTTAASDLQETQSKSNAVFGASAQAITAWSKNSATAFGMSRQAALESASSIGNMFKQLGAGETEAAKTSKSMVELSADLASFHNTAGGATEVLNAMQSAFRGQYEPIQRYIPTINAAAVEQMALATTGKAATSELTRLEKAAAAQAIIMRDAGDAVGDFAKTSGGLANQQRILQANVTDLKAAIGESLLPVAEDIVKQMNAWVGANKDLIGQKTSEAIDGIYESMKSIKGLYDSMPGGVIGAGSAGIVGGLLFGPQAGAVIAAIVMTNSKINQFKADHPEIFEPKFNPIVMPEYVDLWRSPRPLAAPGPAPTKETPMSADLQKLIDAELQKFQIATVESTKFEQHMIGSQERLVTMELDARTREMAALTSSSEYKQTVMQSDTTQALALISEQSEAEVKAIEDSEKLAAEKAKAYAKMYGDMKGDSKTYYDYQLKALDKQRDNYEKLVGKNAVTDAWYARKKKALDQELTLSSNDFFGGIQIGYDRARESAVTFAQVGQSTFESFTAETSNMLSDNFFNLFTGNMDKLTLDWEVMWQGMARTASDRLAQIATDKALDVAISGIDWLGSAMGWWAAGSWDIKKDQIAQLHKGEMVVPADEADKLRSAAESNTALGESWGGSKSFAAGSFGAQVEQSIKDSLAGSLRSFGLNKLTGLAVMGQISPSVNPMGILGSFAKAAMSGLYSAYKAYTDFKTIYGDIDMDWGASSLGKAMPYGKISFDDMTKNFAAWGLGTYNPRDWGEGGEGGGDGSLGLGDFGGVDSMGRSSGVAYAHEGARLNLRNDEGFFVGQKGEEVVTEKNLKRLESILGAIGAGAGGSTGPVSITLNIDGNKFGNVLISQLRSNSDVVSQVRRVANG